MVIPELCKDCGHVCVSLSQCLKQQEFNIIVHDALALNRLKSHIKKAVPHFKGIKKWLIESIDEVYEDKNFDDLFNGKSSPSQDGMTFRNRFLTITFDPKKFTFNELTQPEKLIRYAKNALNDLKNLFKGKPIIIIEYHKSGIPHIHMNYECASPLEHSTLILRLKYFFSESLRNRNCIHDRVFNNGGIEYMKKANKTYFTFKD